MESVREALQSGSSDLNSKDPADGKTGLMLAFIRENVELATLLLENPSIDVNLRTNAGSTALLFAVSSDKNKEVVPMLLAHPHLSNVNEKDNAGNTVLKRTMYFRATKCLELLLNDKRVDPNLSCHQSTPLLDAVFEGEKEYVKLLLSNEQTDPNITNIHGGTPLLEAVGYSWDRDREECVELLLDDERVDPNIEDNDGRTPLLVAVYKNREIYVKLLLENDQVDPNRKNIDGDSALMLAVKTNETVQLLLADLRVDLDTRDNYKRNKKEVKR